MKDKTMQKSRGNVLHNGIETWNKHKSVEEIVIKQMEDVPEVITMKVYNAR